MDTDDPVLRQLRKLREGAGLTTDRLAANGAVMSALGTADSHVGVERLIGLIAGLDDSERLRALRVDLGLDLPALLGREPVVRERELLGTRRAAYAEVVQRDVKTLARWSDRALAELRGHLLSDTFTGHLYVVAAVRSDRIVGTTFIQEPLDGTKEGITERSSMDIPNPCDEPSMPCLIYAYPRDWQPASLTLAVVFRSQPYPAQAWGGYTDNILTLAYGVGRYPLTLNGDTVTCRFVKPRTSLLYGVWWRGNGDGR